MEKQSPEQMRPARFPLFALGPQDTKNFSKGYTQQLHFVPGGIPFKSTTCYKNPSDSFPIIRPLVLVFHEARKPGF